VSAPRLRARDGGRARASLVCGGSLGHATAPGTGQRRESDRSPKAIPPLVTRYPAEGVCRRITPSFQSLADTAFEIPLFRRRGARVGYRFGAGTSDPLRRLLARAGDAVAEEGGASNRRSDRIVMIVDDEPLLIELAEEMIIGLGYSALTFDSGDQARAAFDNINLKVDLVLTDEKMPGLSGSELATDIRARGWRIPVIMMSGNVTSALRQRARAARVCALLRKPLSREVLAAALAHCLKPAGDRDQGYRLMSD
jgi:CheY-like chemotaxis protein